MSLLNHSCDPNCSIVFNGPHLLLRAVREIEAGEEVRRSMPPTACFPYPTPPPPPLFNAFLSVAPTYNQLQLALCCPDTKKALEAVTKQAVE